MSIKYTKDGKKVVVVGSLNNQETIVQEVFVSENGAEIPCGENFVVSSLLDEPLKSWKEKNLLELENRYNRERERWTRAIEEQSREFSSAVKKAKLRTKQIAKYAANCKEEQLDRLLKFLSGEITHYFVDSTSCPGVHSFTDDYSYQKRSYGIVPGKIEELKLISLYGRSDGNLLYRMNTYSDGSGSSQDIVLFSSYEEAVAYAQRKLNTLCEGWVKGELKSLNLSVWRDIEGVVIPKDAEEKEESIRKESNRKRIAELEDKINKLKEEV